LLDTLATNDVNKVRPIINSLSTAVNIIIYLKYA